MPSDERTDLRALASGAAVDPDASAKDGRTLRGLARDLGHEDEPPVVDLLTPQRIAALRAFDGALYDELADRHGWPGSQAGRRG